MVIFPGIAFAHQGHEHASNAPVSVAWGLQGAMELINVHPLFVHFPIALLMACVVFYIVGIIFKKGNLLIAGKWTLYLGTLSATFAVWTGLRAAETVEHGGGTHQIMMAHQYLGITILVSSVVLSLWLLFSKTNVPAKGRTFFVLALLVQAAILIQQADFGGRMIFLNGVGVGKKSAMVQESHSQNPGGEGTDHHDHGEHGH